MFCLYWLKFYLTLLIIQLYSEKIRLFICWNYFLPNNLIFNNLFILSRNIFRFFVSLMGWFRASSNRANLFRHNFPGHIRLEFGLLWWDAFPKFLPAVFLLVRRFFESVYFF